MKYWSVTETVIGILLSSNQMILQFGVNKHSQIFQRLQIAYRLVQFLVVFEKFACAYLFQIGLEII